MIRQNQSSLFILSGLLLSAFLLSACGTQTDVARERAETSSTGTATSSTSATSQAAYAYAPALNVMPGRERYAEFEPADFQSVRRQPVSTFSVDVDTAAYSHVRRFLRSGQMPPPEAVRIEELVNYFDYDLPAPSDRSQPFSIQTTLTPSPWAEDLHLLHVSLQGYSIPRRNRPPANLTLLVDVSGSMQGQNRLTLVQDSLEMLLNELSPDDKVALVTYAGSTRVALDYTPVTERNKPSIRGAIERLAAGGSTAGASGLELAYAVAQEGFDSEAVNRVILATDGDFNVGTSSVSGIARLIEEKRRSGIYLSVLTVGDGNVRDDIAQALAQKGNGRAAHLDGLLEAQKVLESEFTGNLFPIADDVKIQIEFNPLQVTEYRLIGYETRALKRRDFSNDRVDAGEVGSGHSVTAIYEVALTEGMAGRSPSLRYQVAHSNAQDAVRDEVLDDETLEEFGFLRIRYKRPGESQSQLIQHPIGQEHAVASLREAPQEVRFAAAVAGFGLLLRDEGQVPGFDYEDVIDLAQSARGEDTYGLRGEFTQIVRLADSLSRRH